MGEEKEIPLPYEVWGGGLEKKRGKERGLENLKHRGIRADEGGG